MDSDEGRKQVKRVRLSRRRTSQETAKTGSKKRLNKASVDLENGEGNDAAGPSKICVLDTIPPARPVPPKTNRVCVKVGKDKHGALPNFSNKINTENKENKATLSYEKFVTRSHNIVHYLSSNARSIPITKAKIQCLQSLSSHNYSCLTPCAVLAPFQRRVTSIACHPTKRNLIAAASKGGELALFNTHSSKGYEPVKWLDGMGPGGSVVDLQFHPLDPSMVYTAAVSGKLKCESFSGQVSETLRDTGTLVNWFCSLDVMPEQKIIGTGDCTGNIYILSQTGEAVTHKRGHKSKVTSMEFCKKSSNLLLTASTDKTVKLWDFRMFSQSSFPLHVLDHNKGVNSARFNPNCSSVLTTDQYDELRIYSSPWWELEATILHPHRHFQHLTSIKASWCPWNDEIVIGRYPDQKFLPDDERTIDFYDTRTKKELHRLQSHQVKLISSLNMFNCNGDTLVSGSGCNVVFWRMNKEDPSETNENFDDLGQNANRSRNNRVPKRSGPLKTKTPKEKKTQKDKKTPKDKNTKSKK